MGLSRGSGLSNGSGLYGGFSGLSAGSGLTGANILPQTTAWQAAVVANGGSVSPGRLVIVNQFIAAEVSAGTWALTDDYWGFWAENAVQALTSLKQLRLAAAVNSPTFTANLGYAPDGVTNYINTGFAPLTHAVAMSAANARGGIYERTDVNANTTSMGSSGGVGGVIIRMRPRNASTTALLEVQANGGGGSVFTLPVSDSRGFTTASRNGATAAECFGYKNGAVMTRTTAPIAFGAALPSQTLYLGALNNSGSAANFRSAALGFSAIGAAFSALQEAAQYNNAQAWAAAVGASV